MAPQLSDWRNFLLTLGRARDAPGAGSARGAGAICASFWRLCPPRGARAQLDSALVSPGQISGRKSLWNGLSSDLGSDTIPIQHSAVSENIHGNAALTEKSEKNKVNTPRFFLFFNLFQIFQTTPLFPSFKTVQALQGWVLMAAQPLALHLGVEQSGCEAHAAGPARSSPQPLFKGRRSRAVFPPYAALAARGAPNPSNIPSVGAVRMINRRNLKGKQEVVKTCSWNVIYGGVL